MAGNTVDLAQQFQAAGPGVAMVGGNTRVKGQPGFLGTQTDSLTFGGGVGTWTVPNTRTRILGAFMISASGTGIEAITNDGTSPIAVTAGDARIRSL
ncbi:MAG TPA: hypothetical protein VIF57_25705 [Polyangia bacterium]|jgi:hypothetical protein